MSRGWSVEIDKTAPRCPGPSRHTWMEVRDVAAHRRTARDVMATEVVAVAPGASLRQIADLFEIRRIRRVPVVKDGKIVGIVSRANFVQALAVSPGSEDKDAAADRIRDLLLAEYARRPGGCTQRATPSFSTVRPTSGGLFGFDAEREALRLAAEVIPRVKGFEDQTIRYWATPAPGHTSNPMSPSLAPITRIDRAMARQLRAGRRLQLRSIGLLTDLRSHAVQRTDALLSLCSLLPGQPHAADRW